MAGFRQDLRFTYRTLVKSKGFTLVAVLALALGIGGTTVMYSAVDGILLRPLPYPDSDRLVRLWETWKNGGFGSSSWPNLLDWRAQSKTLTQLAGMSNRDYTLARNGEAERIPGLRVTGDFFNVLGAKPFLGRAFTDESFKSGDEAVLSYELWQRSFGGEREVIGRTVRLSDKVYTIVGVLPSSFRLSYETGAIYVPFVPDADSGRGSHFLNVVGRLVPGATLPQASAELDHIATGLEAAYPDSNTDRRIRIRLWHESITANLRPAILLLFGAVVLVLVIACANVANMLIARAAGRESELALRFALGATRFRVVRQLLTEGLVLALLGGAAGLLVAIWGVDACRAIIPRDFVFDMRLDGRVVAFAGGVALLSVLAFGLLPALRAVRGDLAGVMKEGSRTVVASRSRLRTALVIVQVALSFALLVGATLLGRSFARLAGVDPGFDPKGVLTVQMSLPPGKDPAQFYTRVLERVQAIPQVTSAGITDFLPLSPNNINGGFKIEGKDIDTNNEATEYMVTSPDYFKTMGIPVVRGRGITAADGKETQQVAVINQTMAKKYWGDEDPIGKHLKLEFSDDASWMTVVGVIGDVRRWSLDGTAKPETWVPITQVPFADMSIAVRGHGDLGALAAAVRREVAGVDPEQAVFNVTTMTAVVDESLRERKILLDFTAAFGLIALGLAAIGLYGVLAVQVAQRTHEIGIRMALGARPNDVRRMVVQNGVLLTVAGAVVGAATAFFLSSVLDKLLYAVAATDPATYVAVGVVLVVVAFFAAWVPARRATRIDPMIALRAQ